MRHILLICFWFCLVQAQERFFFNGSPFTVQNNAKTTVITVNASPTCYEPAAILTDCRKKKEMGFLFDPILYYQDASPFGLYHQPYQAVRIQPSVAPQQLAAAKYVYNDFQQSVDNKEKISDLSPSLNSVNEFPDTSGRFLFAYSTVTTTLTATALGKATQTLSVGCLPPGGEIPKPYCLISFNAILPNGVTLQQMCYAIGVAAQMKTTCVLIGILDLSRREARQIGVRFKITFEQLPGGNPPSRGLISRNLVSSFILSGNLYTLIGLGGIFNPLDFFVPGFDNIYAAAAKPVPCILKSTLQCGTGETCKATTGLCDCSTGYVRNPITNICNDIDECLATSSCSDSNSICANTIGSFKCGCKPGFVTDGVKCVDVDECAAGVAQVDCAKDPNAVCTNSPGGYKCECKPTFSPDKTGKCIDACTLPNPCGEVDTAAKCSNLQAPTTPFVCTCSTGYELDATKKCVDTNECLAKTPACSDSNSICANTVGSFKCNCKSGFTIVGLKCVDVDECSIGTPEAKICASKTNFKCVNTIGSYTCDTCQTGYQLKDVNTCEDVDECLIPNFCGAVQCTFSPGISTCSCSTSEVYDMVQKKCFKKCTPSPPPTADSCISVPGTSGFCGIDGLCSCVKRDPTTGNCV